MAPAEALRYNERTASERLNARLKEEFGARHVMVRGHKKVNLHLMFGIIALFADQLVQRWSRFFRQYRAGLKWWAALVHIASFTVGSVLQ